ncbi:MAG TPA: TRAP transporter small permease subunit [Sphingobium sp.]|nr:TRAP transporter small permease subunit [Sphingobium sp.]
MKNAYIWIGGIALVLASATDVLAVVGRHIGVPLRGSIELVQAFILVAGGIALIIATHAGSHARVHILADRMSPPWKARVERVAAALSALLICAFLAGGLWIAADLWGSQEVSELLHLPYRVLRIICNVCLLLVLLAWLRKVLGRERP